MKINIRYQFSEILGGEYKKDGNFSGEEFKEQMLIPIWRLYKDKNDIIEIDMDGTYGVPENWLIGAFGTFVIEEHLKRDDIERFHFISEEEPNLIEKIKEIMEMSL